MNFSFLPSKIKNEIKALVADKIPISLARSSSDVDGTPGESYVVAYEDRVFIFSRKMGAHDYLNMVGEFGKDIASVNVRKDGIHTFLDTDFKGKKYSIKFSSFEDKSLFPIQKQCENFSKGAIDSVVPKTEPQVESESLHNDTVKISDNISNMKNGLAIALMYVSAVDGEISKEEDHYIINVFNNNQRILKTSLNYYKTHSYDEFLVALGEMNQEQTLCFVANMMELGMCDGVLHRSEFAIIRKFCESKGVSDDEYDTLKQVLLIKNTLSVL